MVNSVLPEAAAELDGYGFGGLGSTVQITAVDFGTPGISTHDTERPRADGIMFGRDWRGGRVIAFELVILTEYTAPAAPTLGGYGTATALAALGPLSAAWQADPVRTNPGSVSALRFRLGGQQRVIYGRGRKFAFDTATATRGRIPVTCDFQAIDHLFYDDVQYTTVVDFVPPPAGGLTWPITFPWSTVQQAFTPGDITVDGDVDTWLVIVINGPIAAPRVRSVGQWEVGLDLTLLADQYVVIDPRPWSRGVRLSDGRNVAGSLTFASPRLSELRVPPGHSEIVLGGQDDTGASSMLLAWRAAYTSP